MMLESERHRRRLRRHHRAARRRPRRPRRQRRRPARRQRRRQDHPAAGGVRSAAARPAAGCSSTATTSPPRAPHQLAPARHLPRPRRPRRSSRSLTVGRTSPAMPARAPRTRPSSARSRRVPPARRAAGPDRRHDERRRAADAGPRPGLRAAAPSSSCSTRCRWAWPRRSSTRSSTSSAGWPPRARSLLLVEQYVTRALDVADYVYLLNQGQVAFAGEPGELDGEDVFTQYVGATVGSSI